MENEVLIFIFHGFLGGVLWLFMNWIWTKKAIAQHTIVSAIAGSFSDCGLFLLASSLRIQLSKQRYDDCERLLLR